MLIPRFLITNKTLKNISSIQANCEVIEQLPLVPVWELRLREETLIREIFHSLKSEGNKLSLSEVEKIIKEEPLRNEMPALIMQKTGINALEKDIQEVMNYRNALKIVDQWVIMQHKRSGEVLYSKEQLFQIQVLIVDKLIDSSEIGTWRKMQVTPRVFGQEVFKTANVVEIPYQIDDLFSWLATKEARDLHPVVKAAVIDFELTRIQPFSVGSDRVSKTFVLFCLAAEGINRKRLITFEEQRSKEMDVLYRLTAEAARTGMLTSFLENWTGLVEESSSKTRERVQRLAVDTQVRGKIGHQISLNDRQIRLIEFLEAKDMITMNQVRGVSPEVSDDTILRDLKDLIKKGLVKKKGKTKGARYALKKQ